MGAVAQPFSDWFFRRCFCETACSSVFHIFCTEIANLHGVTLDQDRKSQGLVGRQSSRVRAELRRKSHHYTHTHITGRSVTTVLATKPLSLAFRALPSQTLILLSILFSPLCPFIHGQTELFPVLYFSPGISVSVPLLMLSQWPRTFLL